MRPQRLVPSTPALIRGYDIVREIKRGGQGVVYEAIQSATRRTVALKIMLEDPGRNPAKRRRRFEAEIEMAAGLTHPAIVPVFDSGLNDNRLYYVMEYVPGESLNEHLATHMPPVDTCLQLFEQIASAVSHAHQHGVIHRDLKPGNILIDDHGRPHLLDFGVARRVSGKSVTTASDEFVGTLRYASPEHVASSVGPIDVRSDVYALGLILYEMLIGQMPYPIDGGLAEVSQHIRVTAPQRSPQLTTDLTAICEKALAKEPEARYSTVVHLIDDLRRFKRGEAVEARRGAPWYAVRRFVRRHRARIIPVAAAAVVVMLAGWWQISAVANARDAAITAQVTAERITVFLQSTFESIHPSTIEGEDVSLLEAVLQDAGERATSEFNGQPLAEAAVRGTLGDAFRRLGRFEEAEAHLHSALELRQEALPASHLDVAGALGQLAELHRDAGQYDIALGMQQQALAQVEDQVPSDDPALVFHLNNLASIHFQMTRFNDARPLFERAAEIARAAWSAAADADTRTLVEVLGNLGQLHAATDGFAEAEALYHEALAHCSQRPACEPESRAELLNSLAVLRHRQGDWAASETLHGDALRLRRALLGRDHLLVAETLSNLALVLKDRGDQADREGAEIFLNEALAIRTEKLSDDHIKVAHTLNDLASVVYEDGRYDEAEAHWTRALDIYVAVLGEENAHVGTVLTHLGLIARHKEQFDVAEQRLIRALVILEQVYGTQSTKVAETRVAVGVLYRKIGAYDQAAEQYNAALIIFREVLGEDHIHVAAVLNALGLIAKEQDQFDEAERLYTDALDIFRKQLAADHPSLATSINNLGRLKLQLKDCEGAVGLLTEAEAIRSKVLPEADTRLASTRTWLGDCLTTLGEYSSAEPLLLASHKTMVKRYGPGDKRTLSASDRIFRMYTEWDRPEQAEPYRRTVPD
jgi:tetratricopeptide (TPR) repeat protein